MRALAALLLVGMAVTAVWTDSTPLAVIFAGMCVSAAINRLEFLR